MATPLRILIVEDSEADAELLLRELRRGGYAPEFERVETPEGLDAALARQSWDLIVSDYAMPQLNGLQALKLTQEKGLDIPFILVSGSIGEDIAVAAMKAGAHDYLMKGNTARLIPAIERELKEAELRREYRRTQERVQYLAYYDPLTDLPNRTLFADRLQQAVLIGRRENQHFALLILDLDRFKNINDALGHHAGDQALQQAATRLKACVRESDTVARIGGDEFSILLPAASHLDDTIAIVRKVLETFTHPLQIGNRNSDVGVSLGIALFPEHGNETDTLMRAADAAMYEAKRTHSGFKIYSPDSSKPCASSGFTG